MAIIVNADDFGISENVNTAITEAFKKGLIDRTTLMVNMPFAEDAMEIAKEEGFDAKVGLHINLTSGIPITREMAADRVMCDSNGEFTADFARNLKTRFFLPKKTRENVEKEIRAQLDRYRALGGTLWHVDSHHYVHTDPSVWIILRRVLKDYPITSVRLGRNMYVGGNPLLHIYKIILNSSVRSFCKGNPCYFGSAQDYREYIQKLPECGPEAETEIMVHPVYDDNGCLCDEYMGRLYKLEPVKDIITGGTGD